MKNKKSPQKKRAKKTIAKKASVTSPIFCSKYPAVTPSYMVNPADAPRQVKVVKASFILQWLLRGWALTSQQAWRNFGHTRLADAVFQLKKRDFIIITTMMQGIDRFGNKTNYGSYRLIKSRSKKAIQRYKKMNKK